MSRPIVPHKNLVQKASYAVGEWVQFTIGESTFGYSSQEGRVTGVTSDGYKVCVPYIGGAGCMSEDVIRAPAVMGAIPAPHFGPPIPASAFRTEEPQARSRIPMWAYVVAGAVGGVLLVKILRA